MTLIASIQGALEAQGPDHAIINVGGIGLRVYAPTSTLANLGGLGQQVRLYTHLYFKEENLALYGFGTQDELRLFSLLMNVSGIGPRTALKALSVLSPQELVTAIATEEIDTLTRIPGVGRKTAARLALELKEKLEKEWVVAPGAAASAVDGDALAALTTLGYSPAEARASLASLENARALPLEEKVRQALQRMGRR